MSKLAGLWLPIITPFADGIVDLQSYENLLEHYLGQGVAGIFPLGTTGEAPTIDVRGVLSARMEFLCAFMHISANHSVYAVGSVSSDREKRMPRIAVFIAAPILLHLGEKGLRRRGAAQPAVAPASTAAARRGRDQEQREAGVKSGRRAGAGKQKR